MKKICYTLHKRKFSAGWKWNVSFNRPLSEPPKNNVQKYLIGEWKTIATGTYVEAKSKITAPCREFKSNS